MARITGLRGSIYLADSVTKVADSYNWEYEEAQEVLDCTIKGEPFKRYAASVGTARVRVQAYTRVAGPGAPLTALMATDLVTNAGVGTPVDFTLWGADTNATNPKVVGQGYIVRSQLRVPRDGLILDEIEIEVDGKPSTVQ